MRSREEGVPLRAVAEAIGHHLKVPVVALAPEESERHVARLDRIARMDVPASSALTGNDSDGPRTLGELARGLADATNG